MMPQSQTLGKQENAVSHKKRKARQTLSSAPINPSQMAQALPL